MWALVLMEAAAVVPLLSLAAAGPGIWQVLGPLLTAALLPLGFGVERSVPALREPRRRVAVGLILALGLHWLIAPAEPVDARSAIMWLLVALVPVLAGVALYWRGASLAGAETTASDVRTEFVVVCGALLGLLTLFRSVLRPEPVLLLLPVIAVLIFGLLALTLARQDAARATEHPSARSLAAASATAPAVAATVLVGGLTPALLAAIWAGLAALLAVMLAPLMALLSWLASLLPTTGGLGDQAMPTPPPPPQALPPPLEQEAALPEWLGVLVLVLVAVLVAAVVFLVVRLLLSLRLNPVRRRARRKPADQPVVATAGSPRRGLMRLLHWLLNLLRPARAATSRPAASTPGQSDARAAYRALLAWARQRGVTRRPAETTQQFRSRLSGQVPERSPTFELVTQVYEQDHYGGQPAPRLRLREVERSLRELVGEET